MQVQVSVLYREPKLLKEVPAPTSIPVPHPVSVLYREPKLLKAMEKEEFHSYEFQFQCSTVSRNC